MPDQLAHYLFARRVLAASGEALRRRIRPDSPLFRAGTFGPDPLFNDPSPRRRAESFELHRSPGCFALERMRPALQAGMPHAAEYAAGFFCHYALDRICHPYIKAMAARGESMHVAIETAYDRALHLRGEGDLPLRIRLSGAQLRAAVQMYRRLTPRQFAADLEIYWQIRRLLILSGGTVLAPALGRLRPGWNGLIPYKTPSPALEEYFVRLDALMEAGVAPAADQLARYLRCLEENLPLDPWTNADFSGFHTQD